MDQSLFITTAAQYARSILPWFILGIGLAFILETHLKPKTIKRYLGSFENGRSVVAIILGMISPLSIMSFLPVAREFVDLGAHPGILFSFLIAERAYDLQSFFIIASLFGIRFAVLNALAIFTSLYVATLSMRSEKVRFKTEKKKQKRSFWQQQIKLIGIVIVGIIFSALLRTLIPQDQFKNLTGDVKGGLSGGLIAGFLLYLGPIMANYPVGKAFLDLGMAQIGVFAFLTVSPVINFVIIMLFGAAVGYRATVKAFFVYGAVSMLLTLMAIPLLH